MLFDTVCDSNN